MDLAAVHAWRLDLAARDAGILTQPPRRISGHALWSTNKALEREFFRDACDDADRASEGDAIRAAWPA